MPMDAFKLKILSMKMILQIHATLNLGFQLLY